MEVENTGPGQEGLFRQLCQTTRYVLRCDDRGAASDGEAAESRTGAPGLRLLAPGGRLSYVVTNKWLRAGYAEELRDLFASKSWVEFVSDFGHAKKFFPDADVFPSVIAAESIASSDRAGHNDGMRDSAR